MCECVCVCSTLFGYLHKGVHVSKGCTKFICDGGPRWLATTDTVSWTDVLKCAMTLRHCWIRELCCWFTGQSDCNGHIHEAYGRSPGSSRSAAALLLTEQSWLCVKRSVTNCRASVSSVQHTLSQVNIPSGIFPWQHAVNCACYHSPFGSFIQAHWTNNLLSLN